MYDEVFDPRRSDDGCDEAAPLPRRARLDHARRKSLRATALVGGLAAAGVAMQLLIVWLYAAQ
ncbi:hypothetical protein D0T25_00085 [Duganella sp. BJB488]|uniref:hypothetical protein n=1 Tax=unclassified Duganella TaxID=2636909 RepID=UPI000E34E7B4|nr:MULTISPECIES: hypothetical protein [unclassified Duganella]RFP26364.1 hypothetical protein D0T26_03120 [Duganella sp. BJB489]RFP27895.1 hypothetical protein D0T25_00085 [Duganella sp. BJB488]RFP37296.1 hypothetical protein D0T24_11500 [Duganella sp. BJB480]